MAGFSDSLENSILSHVFRNSAYTSPTTVYAALYTVAPTDAGGGTEVSGNAYARQAVTSSAPSGGSTSNSGDILFPVATGSWGTVVAVGIFDASSAGNLLAWANLGSSVAISTNDQFKFAATQLSLSLD